MGWNILCRASVPAREPQLLQGHLHVLPHGHLWQDPRQATESFLICCSFICLHKQKGTAVLLCMLCSTGIQVPVYSTLLSYTVNQFHCVSNLRQFASKNLCSLVVFFCGPDPRIWNGNTQSGSTGTLGGPLTLVAFLGGWFTSLAFVSQCK